MFVEVYVSEYLVFTERFTVSGDGWNAVYADISGVHSSIYAPAAISRVVIGVENAGENGSGELLLDGPGILARKRIAEISRAVGQYFGRRLHA